MDRGDGGDAVPAASSAGISVRGDAHFRFSVIGSLGTRMVSERKDSRLLLTFHTSIVEGTNFTY